MFTRDERRGLLFLAAVAVSGGAMRAVRAPFDPPGSAIVAAEIPAGDIARQAELARQAQEASRPLGPGERVDVDKATSQQIERLPRVGPALARRIVDEREAHGPFGSLAGLRRVPGIGPAMLRALERSTSFSGTPYLSTAAGLPTNALEPVSRDLTDSTRGRGRSRRTDRLSACPSDRLSLNTATLEQLQCLPGIGPALASRIVTWRTAHGGFREVQELEQVPGIGPARRERLAALVRLP